MKKYVTSVTNEQIIEAYQRLKSCYKVEAELNVPSYYAKRILKKEGKLRSQSQAAKERLARKGFKLSEDQKLLLSKLAKERKGKLNLFYGKTHKKETKTKLSNMAKTRAGKRNPNYRHGNYVRRTKDFLIKDFKPLREECFKRDDYTCQICNKKGGDLHSHHKLPYWVCKEAYLDIDNLITCCKHCHLSVAHNNDYAKFNLSLISDLLINKYNLSRERLNELANFNNTKFDAIV